MGACKMKGEIVYAVTVKGKLLHLFAFQNEAENWIREVLYDEDNMVILNYQKQDIYMEIVTIK